MQKPPINKQRAFTLLELLIVMVILALLAGLGLMSFGTIQMKSRDSRRKQDLANVSKALETYYNDYGKYPASVDGLIAGCGAGGAENCGWGSPWTDDKNTLYMNALPQDPANNQKYFYRLVTNNSYYLFARLENELDDDAAKNAGNPSSYTGYFCGGSSLGCNYLVTSTNVTAKPAID